MSFNSLSSELKILIIEQTLPEGFESLAVTCKSICTLCRPFIEGHNALRSRYRSFSYCLDDPYFKFSTILTAFHLIARIASEPVVARYIFHADLSSDSRRTIATDRYLDADAEDRYLDAVAEMIRSSVTLRQARLDPTRYYATLEGEVHARRYSQCAAAFLLTLLPNVVTLKLPRQWKPSEASDGLVHSIACRVGGSRFLGNELSLSNIVSLANATSSVDQNVFELGWARSLLALPKVASFHGYSVIDSHATQNSTLDKPLQETSTGRGLQSDDLPAVVFMRRLSTNF